MGQLNHSAGLAKAHSSANDSRGIPTEGNYSAAHLEGGLFHFSF